MSSENPLKNAEQNLIAIEAIIFEFVTNLKLEYTSIDETCDW